MAGLIDISQLDGYGKAMKEAPDILLKNLAKGFLLFARYDIKTLREGLGGQFNIRSKGLANSFKAKATDPSRATDITKIFADEYTGWKASQVFQTGGVITGKGKNLTVLFQDARSGTGKRLYSQQQLRTMIASGAVRLVPTPRGVLIVQGKGRLLKSGAMSKGSRDVVLGILKHSITERKRLNFFENAEGNSSMHMDILQSAIEDTLVAIAQRNGGM